MSDRQPYSRIYWLVMNDHKFDEIRGNVTHMGSWTLMLLAADMAYPAPAYIPPVVPRKSLAALVDAGLVDLLPGHLFRLHGLEDERTKRAQAATRAVPKRVPPAPQLGPKRDPDGFQDETKARDETKAEAVAGAREDADPADAYWSLMGRYPVGKVIAWIDDMAGKYGQDPTTRAMVRAHIQDKNGATLLGRTQDILAAEARALDRKEREDERERLREKRAQPKPLTGPDAEFRAMLEARYAELGKPRDAA